MYRPVVCDCLIQKEGLKAIQITEKKQYHHFVVYTIVSNIRGVKESKRRYSEFESFRKSLVKLYPYLMIPPIPEKRFVSDLKEDYTDKRKRMLERFLNHIISHPTLINEHVVHRFIDGRYNWSDTLCTFPLFHLPKDTLLVSCKNPMTELIKSRILPQNQGQPILSYSNPFRKHITVLRSLECKVDKTSETINHSVEKSQKLIMTNLNDLSSDFAELGSVFNILGFYEPDSLSFGIEKVSQVLDITCTSIRCLASSLEIYCAEHAQEHTQYILIGHQVLRYYHLKLCQLEHTEDMLQQVATESIACDPIEDDYFAIYVEESPYRPQYPENRLSPTRRLVSSISSTVQGFIGNSSPDDISTNTYNKKSIKQLEHLKEETIKDLNYMSLNIQLEFDRLQVQKEAELKSILLSFSKHHFKYCQKNLKAWKGIRNEMSIMSTM